MVNQLLKQYTLKLKENFLLPLYLQNNGSTCLLYHAEITHTHTHNLYNKGQYSGKQTLPLCSGLWYYYTMETQLQRAQDIIMTSLLILQMTYWVLENLKTLLWSQSKMGFESWLQNPQPMLLPLHKPGPWKAEDIRRRETEAAVLYRIH